MYANSAFSGILVWIVNRMNKSISASLFVAVCLLGAPALASQTPKCEAELVKFTSGAKKGVMVYKYVATALMSGTQSSLTAAIRCVWAVWPKRDGALVRELVANFLVLCLKNPEIFLSVASDEANNIQSLIDELYLGFVAGDRGQQQHLEQLRQSLTRKLLLIKEGVGGEVKSRNKDLLIAQLDSIRVQLID